MPLIFRRVPHPLMKQPCIVPISHKPDAKGYVRIAPRKGPKDRAHPIHRLAWISKNGLGSIPEGLEIDHICANRACCNRNHLRLIGRSDHKRITAMMRGADRKESAWCYWTYYQCGWADLCEAFPIKPKTAQSWIQNWKRELRSNPA